jgi:large subunit ribosomal protein L15
MRVGRGEGSGKGKTAGRGQKGQRARGTVKRGFEGGQMPLARRLPKRGFTNIFAKDFSEVRLDRIAAKFESGEVVDAAALKARGLVSRVGKHGVKVLGNGEISFPLTVRVAAITKGAAAKITAAGGTVEGA